MLFIGVDPGKSGAIAFISRSEEPWAVKNTETLTDLRDAIDDAKRDGGEAFAVIETVASSPQMGVKSAFSFGQSFGQLESLLVCSGISFDRVRPQKWQQAIGCLTGGDKNVSKRKAQELFPNIKMTHAIADALLLAEYAKRLKS